MKSILENRRTTGGGSRTGVRGFTIVELLFVLTIFAILAALLFPAVGHMRAVAGRTACQNTLRSLHIKLLAYAQDHNNCLPVGYLKPDVWIQKINPYLSEPVTKTKGEGYCPVTVVGHSDLLYQRDRATLRTDYNVNNKVLTDKEENNRLTQIPGNLVFLYDGGGGARGSAADAKETARHRETLNVLFVDGHIEVLRGFDPNLQRWAR